MTAKVPDLPSYPVWPTILGMTFLALLGGFVWWAATFAGSAAFIASGGPFAWFTMGPPLIAAYGFAGSMGLMALPLWTWAVGDHLADRAGGKTGSAAREMGVTFFSDTHPIAKVTQALAERMGLPPVAHIGWFPNEDINAFAMGTSQENALVAVSKGAVERLTKHQLIAVLAHELGHVASNDMARMTYARGAQEGLTFFLIWRGLKTFARWIFTPLSELELLRMSRAREYTADRISAIMIGPEHMISVLERFQQESVLPPKGDLANVMLWAGIKAGGVLDTHPSFDQRIARLREQSFGAPGVALTPDTSSRQ
jgi:heat shock protein HtpX